MKQERQQRERQGGKRQRGKWQGDMEEWPQGGMQQSAPLFISPG